MFLVRRMFSKAVTQEFLAKQIDGIVKRYAKKPFELSFTYKEAGLDDLDMFEVIALMELSSDVWVDTSKIESLKTFQSVIDLILETSARKSEGSKERPSEDTETKKSP